MIAPSAARKHRIPFTGSDNREYEYYYSAEAEKSVLASMLAFPKEVVDEVILSLSAEDFFVVAHQEILKAIIDLYERDCGIDIITVHQFLADRNLAEVCGSPGILAELAAYHATHLNIKTYIGAVYQKSILRKVYDTCDKIRKVAGDNPGQVDLVVSEAERMIFEVGDLDTQREVIPWRDALAQELDRVRQHKGDKLVGLRTPFPKLDGLTTGWRNEDLIIIGARPGVGKSALMLVIMRKLAKSWKYKDSDTWYLGTAVGCFSLEMKQPSLALRLAAMHASIDLQRLRAGGLSESQKQALTDAQEQMQHWPLYIDDTSSLDIAQIRARARRMVRAHGVKLIIIDYLQLLRCKAVRAKKENRQEEVSEISRNLKQMQQELGIPVICLAQLNRLPSEEDEPQLHHLRESGAIEQDADIVLLLHRKPDTTQGQPIKNYKLILAKQRNGPTDSIELEFLAFRTLFMEKRDEAENI